MAVSNRVEFYGNFFLGCFGTAGLFCIPLFFIPPAYVGPPRGLAIGLGIVAISCGAGIVFARIQDAQRAAKSAETRDGKR